MLPTWPRPFFTPGVFLFKISMLFDAIKLSHVSSCKQLHTGMYNIYILMVACVYTVFVYMRIDASVCLLAHVYVHVFV